MPFRPVRSAEASCNGITALRTARILPPRVFSFLMLSLCLGQSTSPTTSPSPTPSPCSAPPGYFCSGGAALICPIGAYCAGGAALNASCNPVTACTVFGLSAQPPCYWNVSTLATVSGPYHIAAGGSTLYIASLGANRVVSLNTTSLAQTVLGASASPPFSGPQDVAVNSSNFVYVADNVNHLIRIISPSGTVTTLAGSTSGATDGVGALARFNQPKGLCLSSTGSLLFIADTSNNKIRAISTATRNVTTLAGSGMAGSTNGVGTSATFNLPYGCSVSSDGSALYVADASGNNLRLVNTSSLAVTTLGSGLNNPTGVFVNHFGTVFIADQNNQRILTLVGPSTFAVVAGMLGASGTTNGFGASARFSNPTGIVQASSGALFVTDYLSNRIRQLTCVPCPPSYYCSSGEPVICPAGYFCPLSSINASQCPKGSFSNAGAANCTLCPAGTYTSATGSTSCQQCPGGHYCPAGTSSWARLNCGRGNYCSIGSGAPNPCPIQVPPSGGWSTLQVQGPAFLVDTAHCLNHCFWNFTSGDGMLSKC
jgi:DNA-binding beta-propeller fold protein YncE